jgi:hypothetical protein
LRQPELMEMERPGMEETRQLMETLGYVEIAAYL